MRVIDDASRRHFVLGEYDCATFAGKIVEAVHGYNPADVYTQASTRQQKAMHRKGPSRLVREAADLYGWRRIDPHKPVRGAVGLARVRKGRVLITAYFGDAWLAPAEHGVAVLSRIVPVLVWDTQKYGSFIR